jgi:6-phosphofructokinase 1
VDAIDKIRDTASSHNRAFLIETMSRESGYLAIQAGIVSGAEMVLLAESQVTPAEVAKTIEEAYRRGKTHAIIVVAEGFRPHTSELGAMIDAMETGFTARVTILGQIQRGGSPTAFDRLLATRFGVHAVEFLLDGLSNGMVGLNGGGITLIPIDDVIANPKKVSEEYIHMTNILSR